MATLTIERSRSAKRAAHRSNQLGKFVYAVSKYLFCGLTALVPMIMFAVYKVNSRTYWHVYEERSETDWNAILLGWGIVIAGWMVYVFALAMIALVGAVAQAKAESLEIEIALAEVLA